jgi:MFS family permease
MTAAAPALPLLLAQRPFVQFWFARLASTFGNHMLTVVIGWKIYDLTGSAFNLGLVGLIQFVPAVVLTLLIGHVADRYDRRLIVAIAFSIYVAAAALVIVALATPAYSLELLFTAVFLFGTARAFDVPTAHSLVPALVPQAMLPRAVAAWTSANQTAVICGPALGGLIYAVSPVLVCVICLALFLTAIVLAARLKVERAAPPREPPTLSSVLAGVEFLRTRERLLAVITLDLFVIILGGATALLPIYARDILAAGPLGLGLLRSSPALGALTVSIVLSYFPLERHIGLKMFAAVAVFGLATVVFALSTSLALSMAVLSILGAADAVSVVLRFSLVQIETPDAMRGRVNAINYLFVGSSNTLGEFESGLLAAWLGAVPSVLIGGVGSLLVAGLWMVLVPALRRIDRFQPAERDVS